LPEIETHAEDLALMLQAARRAADLAMSHFRKNPAVWYKNEGRSPVSEADVAVDELLQQILLAARPDYGWLSEEVEDNELRLSRQRIFVVDPIDGTRAYVAGQPDWCISIGLVDKGVPIVGVLAAPARDEIWQASRGGGAYLNDKALTTDRGDAPEKALRVVIPDVVSKQMRPRADAGLVKIAGGPSLALRLAAVARGDFDGVYIRPRSNEWDLAAADVMLRETGHGLVDRKGTPMRYNESDPSRALLLAAPRSQIAELLDPLQPAWGH
jgi:myo-inositol-1(or 4)-monophosphatase